MLSGKEICSIIRAGNAAKVATLEVDGLKIIYQGSDEAQQTPPIHHSAAELIQSTGLPGQSHNQPDMSELILTDPAAYEAEMLKGNTE